MKNYAGRTAGQVSAGRCGLRDKLLRGGHRCGNILRCRLTAGQVTGYLWQILRCGLTAGQVTAGRGRAAGQVTAGRAAGSDFQPAQGLNLLHNSQVCLQICLIIMLDVPLGTLF